jgi:hypothetical protein
VEDGVIHLDGASVNVGQGAALSAVLFENLQSAFNSHTHNAIVSSGSSAGMHPTTAPTSPMLPSVGSTSVKIKS